MDFTEKMLSEMAMAICGTHKAQRALLPPPLQPSPLPRALLFTRATLGRR